MSAGCGHVAQVGGLALGAGVCGGEFVLGEQRGKSVENGEGLEFPGGFGRVVGEYVQ